jgi:hypothetical protein
MEIVRGPANHTHPAKRAARGIIFAYFYGVGDEITGARAIRARRALHRAILLLGLPRRSYRSSKRDVRNIQHLILVVMLTMLCSGTPHRPSCCRANLDPEWTALARASCCSCRSALDLHIFSCTRWKRAFQLLRGQADEAGADGRLDSGSGLHRTGWQNKNVVTIHT